MGYQYATDAGGAECKTVSVARSNWDKTNPQLCLIWGRDHHATRCFH